VIYTLAPGVYGPLVSQFRNAATNFYHFDGIGSTDRLTDINQAVTDNYVYVAFGTIRTSTVTTTNPYRYVGTIGYYYDRDLLQMYLRARHYLPALGRFISRDPAFLLEPELQRLYVYAANDPMILSDPSGLRLCHWIHQLGGPACDVPDGGCQPGDKDQNIGVFLNGAGQRIRQNSIIVQLHREYESTKKQLFPVPLFGYKEGVYTIPKQKVEAWLAKQATESKCRPITVDFVGWSRGAVVAIGVVRDINAQTDKYHVRFVGLVDPVATGVPGAPNKIPPIVRNFWVGNKDGQVREPIWVPPGFFKTWPVEIEDPEATRDLGNSAPYHLNHVESGFSPVIKKDLKAAAVSVGVPFQY
jgi:RHS repeat-associated protein